MVLFFIKKTTRGFLMTGPLVTLQPLMCLQGPTTGMAATCSMDTEHVLRSIEHVLWAIEYTDHDLGPLEHVLWTVKHVPRTIEHVLRFIECSTAHRMFFDP